MACWKMRQGQGWLYPTAVLCVYGFLSMMRPAEPFLVPFLLGPHKNFTVQQVSREIYPVWAYSNLLLLIPLFLLTDLLRYKPIIILQALAYMVCWLLFSFGTGVQSMQLSLFAYSVATAGDVGYFTYIYSVVGPEHYQHVTSYTRAAVLLGYGSASLLSQLLVSVWSVSLFVLNILTIVCLCGALLTSLFLPMPQKRFLIRDTLHDPDTANDLSNSIAMDHSRQIKKAKVWRIWSGLRQVLLDCKRHYSSITFLFFCIWSAMGKCGFYQITGYVQILWKLKEPSGNFTAYNGAVDALSTLSGAAASIAVGYTSLNWSQWGELALGLFSALGAGSVFLMDLTSSIWVCYASYVLFKSVYMQLITICTFQIAKSLQKEHYALVFGINTFVAMALQSVLTAVVLNTRGLQLSVTTQYFIYATYFGVISLVFLVRGGYKVQAMKCLGSKTREDLGAERAVRLPESSQA